MQLGNTPNKKPAKVKRAVPKSYFYSGSINYRPVKVESKEPLRQGMVLTIHGQDYLVSNHPNEFNAENNRANLELSRVRATPDIFVETPVLMLYEVELTKKFKCILPKGATLDEIANELGESIYESFQYTSDMSKYLTIVEGRPATEKELDGDY